MFQETIQMDCGKVVTSGDINAVDPNRYAIELVRRLKGEQYLATHLLEPTTSTGKKAIEDDVVADIRSKSQTFRNLMRLSMGYIIKCLVLSIAFVRVL